MSSPDQWPFCSPGKSLPGHSSRFIALLIGALSDLTLHVTDASSVQELVMLRFVRVVVVVVGYLATKLVLYTKSEKANAQTQRRRRPTHYRRPRRGWQVQKRWLEQVEECNIVIIAEIDQKGEAGPGISKAARCMMNSFNIMLWVMWWMIG